MVDGGWITERQFADAVAVGKLTPGPVLLMATFIGYVARGFPGAIVATLTIFAAPFAARRRARGVAPADALAPDGARGAPRPHPGGGGTMAAAAVTLGATLRGPPDFGIAAAAALTLSRFRVNPVIVLVLAGVVRWSLTAAGSLEPAAGRDDDQCTAAARATGAVASTSSSTSIGTGFPRWRSKPAPAARRASSGEA